MTSLGRYDMTPGHSLFGLLLGGIMPMELLEFETNLIKGEAG